jgi:polar amino acid transport system permease protein
MLTREQASPDAVVTSERTPFDWSVDSLDLRAAALPPRRPLRPGRWLSSAVLLVFVGWLVKTLALNTQFGWSDVWSYLFSDRILAGLLVTLELTVVAMVVSLVIGVVLAAMRCSVNPVLSVTAKGYLTVFRGVPLLVQILAWYNLALVFPTLSIGIPFTTLNVGTSTNRVMTVFLAAILALGLHEAAYICEIIRGGIISVPKGQVDAALAVGLTPRETMRRVVLPQTIRIVIPPIGSQLIGMIKATALVATVGGAELMATAEEIYSSNFKTLALLTVVSIWYLVLTGVATIAQQLLEHRLDPQYVRSGSLLSAWRARNAGALQQAGDNAI